MFSCRLLSYGHGNYGKLTVKAKKLPQNKTTWHNYGASCSPKKNTESFVKFHSVQKSKEMYLYYQICVFRIKQKNE